MKKLIVLITVMLFSMLSFTSLMASEAVEEADPATAESVSVSVSEAKICQGISEREPVAPGDVFPSGTPVLYCFTRVQSDSMTEIVHMWYKDDQLVAEVPLNVGISSGWRTFSSKNILDSDMGNWRVEVVSNDGELLKKIHFAVN